MKPIKAIILDTETTGFAAPEPVEIAYLKLGHLHDYTPETFLSGHDYFEQRFNPGKPIDHSAFQIHGISKQMVLGCPQYHIDLLELPDSIEYLICHNISFDLRVLKCKNSGFDSDIHLNFKPICTMKLAKRLWPDLPSYKLVNIMEEHFPAISAKLTEKAHGAYRDTLLCLLIIWKAVQDYELTSWEELHQLCEQKVKKIKKE
jgi:DNA polymerase III epsilon subunit-like protein